MAVDLSTVEQKNESVRLASFIATLPAWRSARHVARRTPVPSSEKQIGARLRQFRETMLLSQTAFAFKAGLSRENLAKYEFGHVPLPWAAGDALCRAHNINQRWLMIGFRPKRPYLDPSRQVEGKIRPRSRFSDIYGEFLQPEILRTLNMAAKDIGVPVEKLENHPAALLGWHHGELFNREDRVNFVKEYIASWHEALPEPLRVPFLQQIEKAIERFGRKHATRLPEGTGTNMVAQAFKKMPPP